MAIIYGKNTAVDYAPGNLASFGKSYSRMGAAPLDMTEVWYDKTALEEYGFKFGKELKTEACLVLRPTGNKSFCLGGENAFILGEAAGFITPSGLEGISSAILSGVALADSFNQGKDGKTREKLYKKYTKKIRRTIRLRLLKAIPMYNPFLRKIVMKLGVTAMQVREK
jgi:flavin-dependent dehydrogenase